MALMLSGASGEATLLPWSTVGSLGGLSGGAGYGMSLLLSRKSKKTPSGHQSLANIIAAVIAAFWLFILIMIAATGPPIAAQAATVGMLFVAISLAIFLLLRQRRRE